MILQITKTHFLAISGGFGFGSFGCFGRAAGKCGSQMCQMRGASEGNSS
jgi:hypothetical protein